MKLPHLKDKIYGGAWSIHDNIFIKDLENAKQHKASTKTFITTYSHWFCKDKNFQGIENFSYIDFCNGTTEAFDKFYHRYNTKRLRLYKGEYFYHQIIAKTVFQNNFCWIDDEPIKDKDVVAISCPFSDTGNIPDSFYKTLEMCEKQNVPVLLDMAYINVSNINNLNLNYKCIDTITTSLSKVFPVENFRIGLRLRQNFYDDNLFAYNQNNYVNTFSVSIGDYFISKYDNNFVYKKYAVRQQELCNSLELLPSNCVIFGIDKNNKFQEYNRGGPTNRLCFSRIWDNRVKQ